MIHIQNTAPGPPTAMAVATPARLPVPTRLASDTANAWKDEMCLSPSWALLAESPSTRIISRNIRNWTKRVLKVNRKAHPNSMIIKTYDHRRSLISLIQLFSISILAVYRLDN